MLYLKSEVELLENSLVKHIPWLVWRDEQLFDCRLNDINLIRLQAPLEEAQSMPWDATCPHQTASSILWGHLDATDEDLCNALNHHLHHSSSSCSVFSGHVDAKMMAIVSTGRSHLFKIFMQGLPIHIRNFVSAKCYYKLHLLAVELGYLPMLLSVEQFISRPALKLMISSRLGSAVQYKHPRIVEHFISMVSPSFLIEYAMTAKQDGSLHAHLIETLCSSQFGITILFELLSYDFRIPIVSHNAAPVTDTGFCLYYSEKDEFGIVKTIKNKFKEMAKAPGFLIYPYFITFLNKIDALLDQEPATLPQHQLMSWFHAGFLRIYINKYLLNHNDPRVQIDHKLFSFFKMLMFSDNLETIKYLHKLVSACNWHFFSLQFSMFGYPGFYLQTMEQSKASSLYILDKCIEFPELHTSNKDNMFAQALAIAAKTVRYFLINDFDFNFQNGRVLLKLSRVARKEASRLALSKDSRSQISIMATPFIIKAAGLLANRFGHNQFIDNFLIRESRLIFPAYRYNTVPERAFEFQKGYPLWFNHSIQKPAGDFHDSIEVIESIFTSTGTFELFWKFLNEKIANKLEHLPAVPKSLYKRGTIRFFEESYPAQNTMDWYLSLSPEKRKMHQALHLALLELEQLDGYNIPTNSTDDGVPRFYGAVPHKSADLCLINRLLFKESSKDIRGIRHGVESHRIQWAAIRFFIKAGIIPLPANKTPHDLLEHIVTNDLWMPMFDSPETSYRSPMFLMSWLRHAPQYEALQKAAVFSFCKSMHKLLEYYQSRNIHRSYENLITTQACFDEQLHSNLPSITRQELSGYREYEGEASKDGVVNWSYYMKPRLTMFGTAPSASSSSSSSNINILC